jgi:hypothetical protein
MATQASTHALQRADERLVGDEARKVNAAIASAVAKYGSRSVGIIAHRLDSQRGQAWGNKSNGDCVVAIVRNGRVATVYLRRATQTFNLGVSRTDVLVDMTGTVLKTVLRNNNSRSEPSNPFNMNRR